MKSTRNDAQVPKLDEKFSNRRKATGSDAEVPKLDEKLLVTNGSRPEMIPKYQNLNGW